MAALALTLAACVGFCPAATAVQHKAASLGYEVWPRESSPEPGADGAPAERESMGPMADFKMEEMWLGEEKRRWWTNKDIVAEADAPAERQQRHQRGGIVFFHIWKTGGTSLCALAQLNGEHIQRAGADEWGCSLAKGYLESHSPQQMAIEGNVTYLETDPFHGGIEKFLLDSPGSPWYIMTVLREPVARMTSEWRHFTGRRVLPGQDLRYNNTALVEYAERKRETFANLQTNWLSNGGTLADAKARLAKFDEVFLTESLDAVALPRLQSFGWTANPGKYLHANVAQKKDQSARALTDEQAALLKQYGADDGELYEFGKALSARARRG